MEPIDGNEKAEINERLQKIVDVDNLHQGLVDKGELILRVKLKDKEVAGKVLGSLYGKIDFHGMEIITVAWDSIILPKNFKEQIIEKINHSFLIEDWRNQ